VAQQSAFAGTSHVCAHKMLHHLKLTVEKFPRMQFEHNLQLQAQLESGIVENCMRSTHFSFHAILFLIFLLHALPRDLISCVRNGSQKQADLTINTSGVGV
jgi:hypothetical protein